MNKKGFAGVAAIIIIAVVILGGGYYLAQKSDWFSGNGNNNAVQPVQQNQTANETANWKTYQNDKYGLQFDYPSNWTFSENTHDKIQSGDADYSLLSVIFTENGLERMKINIYPKEETSKGASINAFKNGYERFNYFHSGTPKEEIVDGLKTTVKYAGCYECYGVDSNIIQKLNNEPISITCNLADICLTIQLIDLGTVNPILSDFFMNNILPTVKLFDTFKTNRIQYQFIEARG
jgi:hypothetical protein